MSVLVQIKIKLQQFLQATTILVTMEITPMALVAIAILKQ